MADNQTAGGGAANVLILHGWGGNKPAHWQERLYAALTEAGATVRYPRFPDPLAPQPGMWLERLADEMKNAEDNAGPLTVVCHSLGAITWMHYATQVTTQVADRVLLVAPPYVMPDIPPTDAPVGVSAFFPPPMDAPAIARAARETTLIASDNDDYATFEQTKAYADRLEIPIHLLSGAGHISPYWGYGEWPWVFDWCLGNADFPPLPRLSDEA